MVIVICHSNANEKLTSKGRGDPDHEASNHFLKKVYQSAGTSKTNGTTGRYNCTMNQNEVGPFTGIHHHHFQGFGHGSDPWSPFTISDPHTDVTVSP